MINNLFACRYGPKVNVAEASAAYKRIAECLRIPLLALSLRWLARHDSVSSIVLGASSASQLLEQMEALQQGPLDDESCAAIEAVHARYPNPCP
jgi:aryl-alcohol dehydrogenase-like predicted oxidoreductase